MSFCRLVVSCDGLERNFKRKPCIPFGPAKSGRESRSKYCVIFLAPLTICTAFLVSAGYWLVSASLAVGVDPGAVFQYFTCVEPLETNSGEAVACPRAFWRVGD